MSEAFYEAQLDLLREQIELMEEGGNVNLPICGALRAIYFTLRDLVEDAA